MFNNIFQQANPAANNIPFGGMQTATPGFAQNNGLNFGNVAPAKASTSTSDELALIKSQKQNNFMLTPQEQAIAGWDLREGTNVAIEIVDPSTERVRVKYTGEEFNIVMQPVETLKEYLRGLRNFVMTTKLTDTTDPGTVLKELFQAFGIIEKLLPQAYENGQKNYSNLMNQMNQMMSAGGYQGNWGGQQMFNGAIGSVPNYFVPDGSTMGAFGQQNNVFGQQQQTQQYTQQQLQQLLQNAAAVGAQNAQQQMANAALNMGNNIMGAGNAMAPMGNMGTPMPTGGTMLNNNPFVQGGQPQQQQQQMNQQQATPNLLNSIPAPGTPVNQSQTPNPSIGGGTTTTATI